LAPPVGQTFADFSHENHPSGQGQNRTADTRIFSSWQADLERWWTPLWRPFRLGTVSVGNDIATTAAAAGVSAGVERCHPDERTLIARNMVALTCEWTRPVVSVAGQSASEMSVDVVIDTVQGAAID